MAEPFVAPCKEEEEKLSSELTASEAKTASLLTLLKSFLLSKEGKEKANRYNYLQEEDEDYEEDESLYELRQNFVPEAETRRKKAMDKSGGVGGSGSVMDKENRKSKMKAWRIDCLRDNDRSNIKNLVKSLGKMRVDDQVQLRNKVNKPVSTTTK